MSVLTDIVTSQPSAEDFERWGAVLVPQLITSDEVADIRAAFTAKVEADAAFGYNDGIAEGDILTRYPRFVHPHRHPDTEVGQLAMKFMLDRRIFDVIETLIGPAHAAQSMFYFKPPTARGQALHQDNAFLRAHPETCIAAWIAIDDCDGDNGGLMIVPGSHTQEILCLEPADPAVSFTTAQVPLPDGITAEQTVMKAGDCLFFHGSLVHGSNPNTTADRFRRSLIFHYIPQSSVEVAAFYDPLVSATGELVSLPASAQGGACGEGWVGPH